MTGASMAIVTGAVLLGAASILLVGHTRFAVAQSAARCMEEIHQLDQCERPDDQRSELWEITGALSVLGALVAALGVTAGRYENTPDKDVRL